MSVRVKVCGITNFADAMASVESGADALGFMFYERSQRFVSVVMAAEITHKLPPFVSRVGVFVNPLEEHVRLAIRQCNLDTLQFHGQETPEFCGRFGLKVIKAFRIENEASLEALPAYSKADAWLLDSFVAGQLGGTGERFNWDLAVEAKKMNKPIILAGGLNPGNIGEAIHKVQPFAVDVSSGVEILPGKKDARKVAEFIRLAQKAQLHL